MPRLTALSVTKNLIPGKDNNMTQDERNAFHQAGHAVSYFIFGWPIKKLTLTAIDVEPPTDLEGGDLIHSRLCCLLSGPRAEQHAAKETKAQHSAALDEDANLALATVLRITTDQMAVGTIAEFCLQSVDGILERHWATLSALATSLLQAKELSGETVRDILSTTIRPEVVDRSDPAILKIRGKNGKTVSLVEGKDFERL
jgi:hypothetical protein